jgi:hypothetical protein
MAAAARNASPVANTVDWTRIKGWAGASHMLFTLKVELGLQTADHFLKADCRGIVVQANTLSRQRVVRPRVAYIAQGKQQSRRSALTRVIHESS